MNVSPLIPAAGIAAMALARGAAGAVQGGLAFAAELLRPDDSQQPAPIIAPVPRPEEFQAALRDFAGKLRERLAAAGVSASHEIELLSDGLGSIQVSGDHPERALIEQTINGDAGLLAEFHALADQCRKLSPPQTEERDRRDFGMILAGDDLRAFLA
jgi:hypothetical protein